MTSTIAIKIASAISLPGRFQHYKKLQSCEKVPSPLTISTEIVVDPKLALTISWQPSLLNPGITISIKISNYYEYWHTQC
ncbi:MAG: hypothetical protein MRQ13_05020 [Candidatus Midichloria sp.]|nr:hypothetical protein [Candidatus Midichloria sp.]